MKSTFAALAFAAAVSAQTFNSSLIPSNVTASCTTFLGSLNSDATLANCIAPLINTTASFSPVSNANLTTADIDATLGALCKNTTGCADSTIRTWLSSFYTACQTELTSPTQYNPQVRELYDILYVVNPLKKAVCLSDSTNQDYCVNQIVTSVSNVTAAGTNTTGASNATLVSFAAVDVWSPIAFAAEHLYIPITTTVTSLSKRMANMLARDPVAQSAFATVITPNTTTYGNTNLPFLFLQPNMTAAQLCTPCTREVMVTYMKWEIAMPYALGLAQSPILGGQPALWTALNTACGPSYVNAINAEVGTLASSNSSSAAGLSASLPASAMGISALSLLAGAVAYFL